MVKMDPTAKYHRTLDSELNDEYAYVGAHYASGSGGATAYTFTGGILKPIKYFKRTARDFKKYATAFEILHSKVPFGEISGTVWPVVDELGVVVGHYGTFDSQEIFVPASLENEFKVEEVPVKGTWGLPRAVEIVKTRLSLKDYLEVGAAVIADKYNEYYLKRGYARWRVPQQSFTVITDIEGHVVLLLSSRDKEALEPVFRVSPSQLLELILDLILVVQIVTGLAAGALLLRMYARRMVVRAALKSGERRLLAKFSQSTEEEIAKLMKEHPRLSRVNAERAVVGPPGSVPEAYGAAGAPEIAKGVRPKSADIRFRVPTAKGSSTVLGREVKTWEGNQAAFNDTVIHAADKMQAGGGGSLLVQVPTGTDARALVQRFKGSVISSPQGVQKFGRYRSINITIVDPSGTRLLEEALEFPASRIPPTP